MELVIDFISVLGITLCAGILFTLLFLTKGSATKKYLIPLFLIILCEILFFYGYLHKLRGLAITTMLLNFGIEFLCGPLIYFFSRTLMIRTFRLKRKHFYHLIPYGMFVIGITVPTAINMTLNEPYFGYTDKLVNYFGEAIHFFGTMVLLIYLLKAYTLWKRHQKIDKKQHSETTGTNLLWLRNMIVGFGLVMFFDSLVTLYELLFSEFSWNSGYLTVSSIIILLIYLSFYGVRQKRVLLPDFLLTPAHVETEIIVPTEKKLHHLANTSDEEVEILERKIMDSLEKDQIFLNEDLTLTQWSETLGISDKKLSELINRRLNVSFYDLINKYRVEEVISKIKSGKFEHYSLLAIALDSGFRSKTSFNRVFKQVTGCSPSQFKKENELPR